MTTRTSQTPTAERMADVRDVAQSEAEGVAQEVTYQARDLVAEARWQVGEQLDAQKSRLADLLREVGDDLEQMADRSDRSGTANDLVRQLAARARDARGYLEGEADLFGDVRRFARRRPGTFLLGALAAGVLAGRATRGAVSARAEQKGQQRPSPQGFTAQPVHSPEYAGEYTTFDQEVGPVGPDRFAAGLQGRPEDLPPATQAVPSTGSSAGVGYVSSPAGIAPTGQDPNGHQRAGHDETPGFEQTGYEPSVTVPTSPATAAPSGQPPDHPQSNYSQPVYAQGEDLRPGYSQQGYTENWAQQRQEPQPRPGEPVDPSRRSDVSPSLDPDAPAGPDAQERR